MKGLIEQYSVQIEFYANKIVDVAWRTLCVLGWTGLIAGLIIAALRLI